MKTELHLNLLDNACSFAVEALKKAVLAESDPGEWKFAILHVVQAIELSLKELLRKQHAVLIYTNVDKPENTVSLALALSRLKKITDFAPTADEALAIEFAAKIRNDLVHNEFKADTAKLKPAFARLFAFLVRFYKDHLDFGFDEAVPQELWLAGIKIGEYGSALFAAAKIQMENDGVDDDDSTIVCPRCGFRALTPFGNESCRCYVCKNSTDLDTCYRCNKVMLWGDSEEIGGKSYCLQCAEYITDDYWHDIGR